MWKLPLRTFMTVLTQEWRCHNYDSLSYDIFIIFLYGRTRKEGALKYLSGSNSDHGDASFGVSLVYLLVIHLDRSALSRFHLVSTVCSFTPFSLRPCCRFRLRVLIKHLYDSSLSSLCFVAVCPPCFFFAFLPMIFMSVWSIAYISHTYNYEDACRITGRVSRSVVNHAMQENSRRRVVASYSIVDETRQSADLYRRINQQRESRKKHSRIGYNFWFSCIFFSL